MDLIQKAERISRRRAYLFLLLALVLVIATLMGVDSPMKPSRVSAWVLLAVLVGLNLSPFTPILRRGGLAQLLNDENAKVNRVTGHVAGFWAMLAATLAIGIGTNFLQIDSFVGARLVMATGLATALVTFALLELRSLRG